MGKPVRELPSNERVGVDSAIDRAAAAIANAIFHATGRRVRTQPITINKLL